MQALAPHRNVCLSHLSVKKNAGIAKKYPAIPNYNIPLSQCFNNHYNDKGLAFLRGLCHCAYLP